MTIPIFDRNSKRYRICLRMTGIVFILILFSSLVMAEENSIHISTGGHLQYSTLDSGYGKFLKERYGVQGLTSTGTSNRFLLKFTNSDSLWVGLEQGEQSGKIKYQDLNGVSRVNSLSVSWSAMLVNYLLNEEWQLEGGFGTNVLIRKFYGYGDNSINSTNYKRNSGRSNTKTNGIISFGQITYSLFNGRSNSFQMAVSYRYTYSGITIRSTDDRPALSEKGVPVETVFDVGGHLGLLQFGINF